MKMQIPRLSKSEKEIMSILWAANRPLSSSEIIELAGEKTWRSNSIHLFLNNLMDKKMIQVADVVIRGKHACRIFEPIYTETDSIVNEIKKTATLNCTPFVRQYDILSNRWGDLLCQEENQTNDIRRNSKNW